jgi:hypothetical protein
VLGDGVVLSSQDKSENAIFLQNTAQDFVTKWLKKDIEKLVDYISVPYEDIYTAKGTIIANIELYAFARGTCLKKIGEHLVEDADKVPMDIPKYFSKTYSVSIKGSNILEALNPQLNEFSAKKKRILELIAKYLKIHVNDLLTYKTADEIEHILGSQKTKK